MRARSQFSRPLQIAAFSSRNRESSDHCAKTRGIPVVKRTSANASRDSRSGGTQLDLLFVPYLILLLSSPSYSASVSLTFDPARSPHFVLLRRQPLSLPLSFRLFASPFVFPASRS